MSDTRQSQIDGPYPGLRPFYREEADYFFGREEHIEELLAKLERNRFVAVVGPSGCGKSSLVRAGLLPMLEHGFMAEAGPNWRMATMRPGNAPFEHLAEALLQDEALGPERASRPNEAAMLEATLRRGPLGLVDAMRETLLPEGTNLLVLVDQFEEIFRYREQSSIDEAEAFVDLILAAAQHKTQSQQRVRETPVYVLITMRSDFFGDCALFMDLPEAINASQFLTPRLSRDQCRAAIVGPARLEGGDIESPLINELLNSMRADADQLPLLQHVLMRLWTYAAQDADDPTNRLSLDHLRAIGGLENALSQHAEEALAELDDRHQGIAQTMLRCLCELSSEGRVTRRLIQLSSVADIAQCSADDVAQVVEVFRRPGRSFLMPPPPTPLEDPTVLDISHESLIRQWKRLNDWVTDEAQSARTYRRLRDTSKQWQDGKAALWRTPDLDIAENWRIKERPTRQWARRYRGNFDVSMQFLDASVAARTRLTRRRKGAVLATISLLLAIAAGSVWSALRMDSLRETAESQRDAADDARKDADDQRQIAEQEREAALDARATAESAQEEAEKQSNLAERRHSLADISSANARYANLLDLWRNDPSQDVGERLNRDRLFAKYAREFTWQLVNRLTGGQSDGVRVLESHRGAVTSVAMHTDDDGETRVVSASDAGEIIRWGMPENSFENIGTPILAFAVSPDGQWEAFAGKEDGTVRLRNRQSGQTWQLPGHDATVHAVGFSPDSRLLASAGDDAFVILHRISTRELVYQFTEHSTWVRELAFDATGSRLASAGHDLVIRIWDTATGRLIQSLPPHDNPITCLAFDPNSDRLVSGDSGGAAFAWDLEHDKRFPIVGHTTGVTATAVSPHDGTIATADDEGVLRLWRFHDEWIELRVPPQRRHSQAINALAYSRDPQNPKLASAGDDGKVIVWDGNVGLRLDDAALQINVGRTILSAFSQHGDWLATVTQDEPTVVNLWATDSTERSQQRLLTLPPTETSADNHNVPSITAIHFHPVNDVILVGTSDGKLQHYALDVRENTDPLESIQAHNGPITAMATDLSGKLLATGDELGNLQLWTFDSDRIVAKGESRAEHTARVTHIAFAPTTNGRQVLASCSIDQTVRLWDAQDKQPPLILTEHELQVLSVAFSPQMNDPLLAVLAADAMDGKPLPVDTVLLNLTSTSEDGTVLLWVVDVLATGIAATLRESIPPQLGAVTHVDISHDGKTMATAGMDNVVRLWDPLQGHLRLELQGHAAGVRQVKFLRREQESGQPPWALASIADDGTLRFWVARLQ